MSDKIDTRLWSAKIKKLTPYVAGEQPKIDNICKLNTNENPFAPSPKVLNAIAQALMGGADRLRLYPDPESEALREVLAQYHGLNAEQIFVGNGSDEVLAFIFACFFVKERPLLMPDISYSFYPVYAQTFGVDTQVIPLKPDFSIDVDDYRMPSGGIIIANPNAPTGVLLGLDDIAKLAKEHPNAVIVIDEAYIDYADDGASAVALIDKFDNLLVVQTFSKSRSLAGLRVGAVFGHVNLITALTTYKNSFNSYPLDHLAQAGAMASILDEPYFQKMRQRLIALRHELTEALVALGFQVLPSSANFVFATPNHPTLTAKEVFEKLRAEGVMVRHWDKPRIKDYLRITVGTQEQNARLIETLRGILG